MNWGQETSEIPASRARAMREKGMYHNPLDRIRASNSPPSNEEENQRALALVQQWSQEMATQIASVHQQQELLKVVPK